MKKIIPWILMLGAICIAILLASALFQEKQRNNKVVSAFKASRQTVDHYKTRSGQMAARIQVQQLQLNEVRGIYPEILNEIRNLKIKVNRVEQFSETVINSETRINTQLRDSILYDTVPARVFDYSDPWITINGVVVNDSVKQTISTRDTLDQVIYRGDRYKPWLWIFSRRKLEQSIISKNPYNSIQYSRTVQIQ